MTNRRRLQGCGRVTNSTTGKEEVVIAGGHNYWGAISSTQIYAVEDDTWRKGTPLPTKVTGSTSLPYGDSFLILGGHNDYSEGSSSCLDSIYQVLISAFLCSLFIKISFRAILRFRREFSANLF